MESFWQWFSKWHFHHHQQQYQYHLETCENADFPASTTDLLHQELWDWTYNLCFLMHEWFWCKLVFQKPGCRMFTRRNLLSFQSNSVDKLSCFCFEEHSITLNNYSYLLSNIGYTCYTPFLSKGPTRVTCLLVSLKMRIPKQELTWNTCANSS